MLQAGIESNISERLVHLREKVLETKPSVCTERALFYTEAYREHENEPVIIRRAYALEKTLKNMTIFIEEGGLIAGNHSSGLRAAPIFPEYAVDWLPEEMDELDKRPGDAFYITDKHKKDIIDCISSLKSIREIHFIPYHTLGKEKYRMLGREYTFGNYPSVKPGELIQYVKYAHSKGFKTKIGG